MLVRHRVARVAEPVLLTSAASVETERVNMLTFMHRGTSQMNAVTKLVLIASAASILAACASQTPRNDTLSQALMRSNGIAAVQSGPNGPTLICNDTPALGSHISHVHCVTPEQAAAEKKAAEKSMQEMQESKCMSAPACMRS